METKRYDSETDRDGVLRIFREIGWSKGTEEAGKRWAEFAEKGRTHLAVVNGQPECLAVNLDGTFRHMNVEMPLSVVGAVATSHVARRQHLASGLTALAVATDAIEEGAILSILGIFDQGFYDRLGYGTGSYMNFMRIDPEHLKVSRDPRPPIRLTADDAERVHANRLVRVRKHGAVSLTDPVSTWHDMDGATNGFGLGYEDPKTGEITHHIWCGANNMNGGPYNVHWHAFRNREEFLELMAVLSGLGDQVQMFTMPEPPGVQMQDLLRRPFRRNQLAQKTDVETRNSAIAWWQIRMNDVPACIGRTRLPNTEPVSFNLTLTDPISDHLDDEIREKWSGVAGNYAVSLGPKSECQAGGHALGLPVMKTSVNTFTRMWAGVRSPTGLSYTCEDLEAPADLLAKLDRALNLPSPEVDWGF